MRIELQSYRSNGHPSGPHQVFTITGMCESAFFRIPASLLHSEGHERDEILLNLTIPGMEPPSGSPRVTAAENEEEQQDDEDSPSASMRFNFDRGQAIVLLDVGWEGVFSILSNDDERAEFVFREITAGSTVEDVERQWTDDETTAGVFSVVVDDWQ
jgi:hypothetical protein